MRKMGTNGREAVLRDYDFRNVVFPKFKKLFSEMTP